MYVGIFKSTFFLPRVKKKKGEKNPRKNQSTPNSEYRLSGNVKRTPKQKMAILLLGIRSVWPEKRGKLHYWKGLNNNNNGAAQKEVTCQSIIVFISEKYPGR